MFSEINTAECISKAQSGDKEAFEYIVKNNLGLVKAVSRHFTDRGTDFEDLVQIGTIGLMKAIRNFDVLIGNRFSTYAVPLITGEIKKFLRDDGEIKVSREIKRNSATVAHKRMEYIKEKGSEPTVKELAEFCGMSEEAVVCACEASAPMLSFSAANGDPSLENIIGNDNISEICEKISLRQALLCLEKDEREIIIHRYFYNLSQSDTGKALGITQVTVSRRERKILEKLKEMLI